MVKRRLSVGRPSGVGRASTGQSDAPSDAVQKLIKASFRGNPLLNHVSAARVQMIVDHFKPVDFEPGQVVFREGDAGDRFFVVESGSYGVTQRMPKGKTQQMYLLKRGIAFGELALLFD